MATNEVTVEPLCIPDNFRFDGKELTLDSQCAVRKDLTVCREGLETLENVHDAVIVICITGPARSGKSFFLSKILKDIKFSLGHTTRSHTTGIWIAVSPTLEEREGTNARIILLDAEGIGALTSVDHGTGAQWDTKIFSLCTLISSLLIYNTNQPTRDDLQKLGFIAQFSDSIRRNSEGKKDKTLSQKFQKCAPRFVWLIRNALLQTDEESTDEESTDEEEDEEEDQDWDKYMKNEVLCIKKGSSEEEKNVNEIIKSIKRTFSSIKAIGIPPPSVDRNVCRKLDDPKVGQLEDVAGFLNRVRTVAAEMLHEAPIKKINDEIMTGSKLAEFIKLYVKAINAEANSLSLNNIYDNAVESSLLKFSKTSEDAYEDATKAIALPCQTEYLSKMLAEAYSTAIKEFKSKTQFTDETLKQKHLLLLEKKLDTKRKHIEEKNDYTSKEFCRKKMESLQKEMLDPLQNDTSEATYSDLVKEKKNIIKLYDECTKGFPNAVEVRTQYEDALLEIVQHYGEKLIKKQQEKAVTCYKNTMTNHDLPCTEETLKKSNSNTRHKLLTDFEAYIQECTEECQKRYSEEVVRQFDEVFQTIQHENKKALSKMCDKEFKNLRVKHFNTITSYIPNISFETILSARDTLFEEVDKIEDCGLNMDEEKRKFKNDVEEEIQHFQKPVLENAFRESLTLYKSEIREHTQRFQILEQDEFEKYSRKASDNAIQNLKIFSDGCKSDQEIQIFKGRLLKEIEKEEKHMKGVNEDRSHVFCDEKMKTLIHEHAKFFAANKTLEDATESKIKNELFKRYNEKAKGPKKEDVKQSYEDQITVLVKEVQSQISSNKKEMMIKTVGVLASMAAGGMGAISSNVASKTFHITKGVLTAAASCASNLSNSPTVVSSGATPSVADPGYKNERKVSASALLSPLSLEETKDDNDNADYNDDEKTDMSL